MNNAFEEEQKDAGDVLFSALIHACGRFAANYNEQVEGLVEKFC